MKIISFTSPYLEHCKQSAELNQFAEIFHSNSICLTHIYMHLVYHRAQERTVR